MQETDGEAEMQAWRYLTGLLFIFQMQICVAGDWRVGVDQGFREARLGIGFGSDELRSAFPAKDLPGIDSPLLEGAQRTMLEILLVAAAVCRIDPDARLVLEPFSNIRRGMALLQSQAIDIIGQTLSDGDVALHGDKYGRTQRMLRTPALIRRGEFEMGVFTTANRPDIRALKDPQDFKSLRGVTVASWAGDLELMRKIVGERIVTVPRRDMIASAIANHRGDFTFSFLSEPVVTRIGGELVRIPGFKVRVPDERAFYLSTDQGELFDAFRQLFVELRARQPDALVDALTRAGTLAPQYRGWADLARETP